MMTSARSTALLLVAHVTSGLAEGLNVESPGLTVAGYSKTTHTGYPVVEGTRVASDATQEDEWKESSRSAVTVTRKTNAYTQADLKKGFGPDISFRTIDSAGVASELGVIAMTHVGDGGSNANINFRTWNGVTEDPIKEDPTNQGYDRLVIHHTGRVQVPAGSLDVSGTGYPLIDGVRTSESSDADVEAKYAAGTKTSLTATRKSTKYKQADFKKGFGPEISFESEDSDAKRNIMGSVGTQYEGDGTAKASIVFKIWGEYDAASIPVGGRSWDPQYTKLTLRENGDLVLADGANIVIDNGNIQMGDWDLNQLATSVLALWITFLVITVLQCSAIIMLCCQLKKAKSASADPRSAV